uniref:Puromycin sensitive aminopeptidase n=1 Tax=Echinococcus granulosus TaxID=6210 RepID=A0A068WXA5_ECHGR|nr:puromycin sensitive aminopeptidase [Echinococcus granulosus]
MRTREEDVYESRLALPCRPEISRDIVPTPEGCGEPPDGHNYVKVTFDRTLVMSTYIVAMVLGDFEYLSAKIPTDDTSNGCSSSAFGTKESPKKLPGQLEIRVYTPLGKRNFGQYALTVARKSLFFYADLFGSPYPLPKLDLVAIPDFACGAMENWGLVTYSAFYNLIVCSELFDVKVGSASDFASQARYDEIKASTNAYSCTPFPPFQAFYEEHEVPCLRVIQQTLESVKINVEQWKRDEKAVGKFLRKLVC